MPTVLPIHSPSGATGCVGLSVSTAGTASGPEEISDLSAVSIAVALEKELADDIIIADYPVPIRAQQLRSPPGQQLHATVR